MFKARRKSGGRYLVTQNSKAWDDYWQHQNTTNSFASEYSDGDGPYALVTKTWLNHFKQFKSDDHVMDLGCGNGALLSLFDSQCKEQSILKWTNVDYAKVRPISSRLSNVDWISCDFTKLPHENDSVDFVISMFGFEYANATKACDEVTRVLKDKGNLSLICHHPSSIITLQSKVSLKVHIMLSRDKLFNVPKKVVSGDIVKLRQFCLERLNYHLKHSPSEQGDDIKLIGQKVYEALHASNEVGRCLQFLEQIKRSLKPYTDRLAQQVEAANNFMQIENYFHKRISQTSKTTQFETGELLFEGQPIAYHLTWHKS